MKVTLDLDQLVVEQRITTEERQRLMSLAREETASLGLNILIAFGVIAVAGGLIEWLHSILAAVAIGLVVGSTGVIIGRYRSHTWGMLGSILTLVGAVTAATGIVTFSAGDVVGYVYVAIILGLGAWFAKSGFLAALTTLAFSGVIGAATDYAHACYCLSVQRPTWTLLFFGIVSAIAYRSSLRLDPVRSRMSLIVSRTSLFLANMGFWVGSLWGDAVWSRRTDWSFSSGRDVPDWIFSIVWAIAIVATGAWGIRRNRRWVVNLMTVFGAIHFYTQYFERLGASPVKLLVGGVLALGIAMWIARFNRRSPTTPRAESDRLAA